ncbi:unnamed protein product [Rangifer tarandus platyrhynchus]|uniref:Uncharacterized protein n=1 Tax=Rangifer tarandus platyrhynchus TaxID=3082113 RepID=A0AC59YXT1_RANTA
MFVKGAGVIRKEPCTLLVNFIIFWSFYCSWRMQGLFPTPTPCVCVREREFDLDGKTILSNFFFWKIQPQKKTHFQRTPLSKATCCFSISCHLLLILPSEERPAGLIEEGSRWGGWG